MNDRRRRLVLGAIPLLAGCTSWAESSTEATKRSTESTSETTVGCEGPTTVEERTPRDDALRAVEVQSVDSSPIDGTSFSVRLPQRVMTAERPATVEITFRNEGSESRAFGFGRPAPFATRASDRKPGWTLLDLESLGESDEPTRTSENCWKPEYDDQSAYEQLDVVDFYELRRCEALSETYQLWTHFRHEECMPAGRYRFEDTVRLRESPGGSEETRFRWGFSVEIGEP